jgi:hypothetical protein
VAPILFGLATDRWRVRVLDLDPTIDPAGAVWRAESLRHDALTAERAGMPEDDRAVVGVVLIEGDAFMGMTQKLCQKALALLDRRVPQILAVQFDQVEGAEDCGFARPLPADKIEHRKSVLVGDGLLAVDKARACR